MFLTDDDYNTLIEPGDLEVAQGSTPEGRERAERMAQEEISSALRSRYNVDAIFAATGDERNDEVIGWMLDIALYHMHAKLSRRMGMETRKERYDSVKSTLSQIARGRLMPDLPLRPNDAGNPMRFNSEAKQRYGW